MLSKLSIVAISIAAVTIGTLITPAVGDTVAWWRFEEGQPGSAAVGIHSVIDHTGNGHHGTPLNGPVYAEGGHNCADSASMAFDGINDRVVVPDHPEFELTQSLTIEVVLSTFGYAPTFFGVNQIVCRGDDRSENDPYYLGLRSDGRIVFFINNTPVVVTSEPVPLLTRLHVAVTLDDASGVVRMYLDKSVVGTALAPGRPAGALTGGNPGIGLGNLPGEGDQALWGRIHEIRISNTALAATEMLTECAADVNCNGTTDVPDIFTFLSIWFSGDVIAANYNRDCCVNVPDIFAFLSDWFAGCP